MPSYDRGILDKLSDQVRAVSKAGKKGVESYTFDLGNDDFAEPPVEQLCIWWDRAPQTGLLPEDKILATRYMILGKKLDVKLGGKLVGSAVLTDLEQSFDAFPVFAQNRLAFQQLVNTCEALCIKKMMPQLKSSAQPAADETEPPSGRSASIAGGR